MLTNSERKTWQACRYKWMLSYGLKLTPPEKPRALRLGTMWHLAMERLAAGQSLEEICGWLDGLAKMETGPTEEGGFWFDLNEKHDQRADAIHVQGMLRRYVAHWGAERRWSPVSPEFKATATTAPGQSVEGYAGMVDCVAEMGGQIWLIEHKTSSRALSTWLDRNGYDQQGLGYAWLVKKALGLNPVGIIYDLAYSGAYSTPRQRKDGSPYKVPDSALPQCSLEDWEKACEGHEEEPWWSRVREGLASLEGYWFREEVVRFDPGDLERFEEEIHGVIADVRDDVIQLDFMQNALLGTSLDRVPAQLQPDAVQRLLTSRAASRFSRNPGSCWAYNRPCPYEDLCKNRSAEAAARFMVRRSTHAELEEEEGGGDER